MDGVYDDAYNRAIELRDQEGYTFIHPFDDENVIAGQGTIGLEILNEHPEIDAIVVPIGGGGLISGVAFAAKSLKPDIKIYGVQAKGAPSMKMPWSTERLRRLTPWQPSRTASPSRNPESTPLNTVKIRG